MHIIHNIDTAIIKIPKGEWIECNDFIVRPHVYKENEPYISVRQRLL